MTNPKKCGDCVFWEPLYDNADLGEHQSGICRWLSNQVKPMWLRPGDAILIAQTLAGAGEDCEVFWRKAEG